MGSSIGPTMLLSPLSSLSFLLTISLSSSLTCYTCNTTYVDRFSHEVTYDDKCTPPENTDSGPVVTCSDPREMCAYYRDDTQMFSPTVRRTGCEIPADPYFKSWEVDTLNKGGDYICWSGLTVKSQYDKRSVCFCNSVLCNSSSTFILSLYSVLIAVIIHCYRLH